MKEPSVVSKYKVKAFFKTKLNEDTVDSFLKWKVITVGICLV